MIAILAVILVVLLHKYNGTMMEYLLSTTVHVKLAHWDEVIEFDPAIIIEHKGASHRIFNGGSPAANCW